MVKTQQQETEMEKVLYETFLACKTAEDVKALLEDLCTYTETEQMAQRAKAAQLLKEGECKINEVCYMTGFNTPSYFTKCFQKQFGILPKDFVK